MKLRWIDSKYVNERDLNELPALRKRTDGFLWLDIPEWSDEAEELFANYAGSLEFPVLLLVHQCQDPGRARGRRLKS
jgi:hypothetical protein